MANFAAEMTGRRALLHLVFWYLGNGGQFETRMHVFTCGSVWTEAGQIICTQNASHVPMATERTVPTEAAIVPRAIFDFALRIDVQKWTFFVVARIES